MTPFEVSILGCGSAMPTTMHNPSSQLVEVNNKLFMIDCGEGTQLQMRRFKTRMSKLHSIFISHLHGDHVFGLPGLISTLNLLGRNGELTIYAHKEIEYLLRPTLDYFNTNMEYEVKLVVLEKNKAMPIFENSSLRVSTFPLRHRIATNGFLFEEKELPRHIRRDMIDFHQISVSKIREIKLGADFIANDGTIVKNELLTTPAHPPRRYAYCSDTAFSPEIVPYIQGVDVLYHEATFAQSEMALAQKTFHSTARQAAEIAKSAQVKKLVIGHFSSRYLDLNILLDEAKSVFENTEIAFEGMKIVL